MKPIRVSHGFESLSEKDKADNELEEIISALEPERENPVLWYSLAGTISMPSHTTLSEIKTRWAKCYTADGTFLIGANV